VITECPDSLARKAQLNDMLRREGIASASVEADKHKEQDEDKNKD